MTRDKIENTNIDQHQEKVAKSDHINVPGQGQKKKC